jgi:type IV pilus assembly protein PilM
VIGYLKRADDRPGGELKGLTVSNRAIGIDVGNHSVKAVVAAKRGASVAIKKCIEIPIIRGDSAKPDRVPQAVEELSRQLRVGNEMVVTSVSTQQATVRNLEIPFSEEEKIRQILKFQTEPYLAFPIEEVIIDFYDTKTAPEGKMKVLLTAIHKEVIANRLELLSRAGIDPEVVDVDFMAIASTALWADSRLAQEGGIIVDVGDSKTIACYIQDGRLLGVRCLPMGGEDFTEAISKELNVGFEQAEQIKTDRSATPPGAAERVSNAISSVFDRLGAELDRTVRYFASQARGRSFDRVLLCGGSASLEGLDRFLAESLSAQVSVLSPPDSVKTGPEDEARFPRFATAVGLALRGLGQAPCLQNFRQEEYAYARPYRRLRRSLISCGALLFTTVALLVFSLFASIDRYKSEQASLNIDIQTKRKTVFPDKTPQSNADMRTLLEDEKKTLTPFRELQGNISLLQVFDDLSAKIPKDLAAELALFNYTKSRPPELPSIGRQRRTQQQSPTWTGTLSLKGTVASVADHVRLREILEKLDYAGLVEDRGTTPAPNGRVNVEYVLRLK